MSFSSLLRLIKTGDPVTAGSVNTPLRQIDDNTRYLLETVLAAGIGQTVYALRETVEASAAVGQPVYFNTDTQQFEKALAVADVQDSSGFVATSRSSHVYGVIGNKHSATLADILLFGLDEIDISGAVGGTVSPGIYYLSGVAPGKLTQQKPPVSVAVLRALPNGRVFVTPQLVDFLDRHSHYRFNLVCRPAGVHVPPSDGDRHVISSPDSSLPGWLPAADPIFAGNAPEGAVFGYNLAQHTALRNVWPPIPLTNASLEWNRGLSTGEGGQTVPLGRQGLCVLDRNGLWWLSDCYGDVPWPTDFTTGVSDSVSESSQPECPRHVDMTLLLWLTRINFAGDSPVVLSLRSLDTRLKVLCAEDPERSASTGNLAVQLALEFGQADTGALGGLVFKEFDEDTGLFQRGAVCEGLYTASSNVILNGSLQRFATPGDSSTQRIHQGVVEITVLPSDSVELDVQLVRLDGATEEHYQDTMYLGFAAGDERSYRAKIQIPNALAISTPQMSLVFLLLGTTAGTLPNLTVTARRVPRPSDGLSAPEALPLAGAEFAVAVTTTTTLTGAYQYVEATSEPFEIAAGETVFFTVSRSASDGYAGDVGLLRQAGVVTTV